MAFTHVPFEVVPFEVDETTQLDLSFGSVVSRSHPSLCMSYTSKVPSTKKGLIWAVLYENALQTVAADTEKLSQKLEIIEQSLIRYQEAGTEVNLVTGQFCIEFAVLKKAARLRSYTDAQIIKMGKELQDNRVLLNIFADAQEAGFGIEKTYEAPLLLHFTPISGGVKTIEYVYDPKLYFFLFHPKFKQEFISHQSLFDFSKQMTPQLYLLGHRALTDAKKFGWLHLPTAISILQGVDGYSALDLSSPYKTDLKVFIKALDASIAELNDTASVPFKIDYKLVNNEKTGLFNGLVDAKSLQQSGWFLGFQVLPKEKSVEDLVQAAQVEHETWADEFTRCAYSRAISVYGYVDRHDLLKSLLSAPEGLSYWLCIEYRIMEALCLHVAKESGMPPGKVKLSKANWTKSSWEFRSKAGGVIGNLLKIPQTIHELTQITRSTIDAPDSETLVRHQLLELSSLTQGHYLAPWKDNFPLTDSPVLVKSKIPATPDVAKIREEVREDGLLMEAYNKLLCNLEELAQLPALFDKAISICHELATVPLSQFQTKAAAMKSEARYTDTALQAFFVKMCVGKNAPLVVQRLAPLMLELESE